MARWPDCFDELWGGIERARRARRRRPGRWSTCCCSAASTGPAQVELAVRGALAAGAHDGRAVAVLARRAERPRSPRPLTDLDARLAAIDRPAPDLADYDQLLEHGAPR